MKMMKILAGVVLCLGMSISHAAEREAVEPRVPDALSAALTAAIQEATIGAKVVAGAAKTGATKAAAFLEKEIPDVIRQLLLWHFIKNAMWVLLFAVVTGVAVKAQLKLWAYWKEQNDIGAEVVIVAFLWAGWAVFAVGAFKCLLDAVYILVAPKVYLIEYAATLYKNS